MNNTFIVYLSQKRTYWWLRRILLQLSFWYSKNVFSVKYEIKNERNNYDSFRDILELTQSPIFVAFAFGVALQYIDPYLYPYLNIWVFVK